MTAAKGTTVPRSELSGYLILTRLLKVVVAAMDDKPSEVTTVVDSQCTISAMEKSGGLLAPYFASRVSEASMNLTELSEETLVHPIQHVPGVLNPSDIATRANSTFEDVKEGSTWQTGPAYLYLPKSEWPFSRDFLDCVPEQEMRTPKAVFNSLDAVPWKSVIGPSLEDLANQVMSRSNCLAKVISVMSRLLKCLFSFDRNRIREVPTVEDLKTANLVLFAASMGPSIVAWENGRLDSLRPYLKGGILYARGRCDKSLLKLLGIESLPILARDTQLARLIMWESHCEGHRASPSDVLARSRQRAWIIRGRFLAKEVCKSCPRCKISRKRLSEQLMSDIPEHQLYPCPPFSYASLDFAGPYRAKAMGNSRTYIKLWGLIIICQNNVKQCKEK